MKKLALLWTCFLLSIGGAFAQTKTITGVVVDENGESIIGASIGLKGTTIGARTDIDGKFTITGFPSTATTVIVKYLGMEDLELPISNDMSIVMKSSVTGLEEVVVVGYGSGQKIGSVVGAVATVKAKEFENRPSPNITDALQGKVPGVMIYTSSGEPSATSTITIRSVGTLEGSSQPLLILDGIAVNATTIQSMNVNDFESVTVLKDASATSIYGSRAANGVIVYTTKKGRKGAKGTISVDALYGISNMAESKLWDNIFDTDGLLGFWKEAGFYTDDQLASFKNYGGNTRWRDYFYRKNRQLYQANISYSGGSEKTDYFVSLGLHQQEGLAFRSKFDRYTAKVNLNTNVNNWFDAGVNTNISYTEQATNPYGSNSTMTGISFMQPPFYTPYDKNGNEYYDELIPGFNNYSLSYRYDMFPYANNKVQLTGSTYMQLKPVTGMRIKSLVSGDVYDQRITYRRLAEHVAAPKNGITEETMNRKYQFQITNTAEYLWNINTVHNFGVLFGQEWMKYTYEEMFAGVDGITDDRLAELESGTGTKTISSNKTEHAYLSYFGRINYSYNDKYFFDLTTRRDESSLLAQSNRSGWFYSLGGRWKLMNENFLKNTDGLSQLDFRISYGTQGRSEINPYTFYSLVASTKYGGESGWNISRFGNPNLGWEKQKQFSVGLEATSYNERFNVILEFYNKLNTDLHVSVPYPYTSGVTSVMKNTASLLNKGIELAIYYDVLKGKDYNLQPYVNLAYNKEKITRLFAEATGNGSYWPMDSYLLMWAVGHPQSFYSPVWAGVDSETGKPQWYIPGDDPSVTTKDPNRVTSDFSSALSQNIGVNYKPDFIGGFGLKASYKGFAFQADFAFQLNKYLVNNDRYFAENPTLFSSENQSRNVTDYWKKPGDITKFPSLDYTFTQLDSRLVEDASFLRMKTISLSYTVPRRILNKTNFFGSARFFFTGRNLLTFTNYTGQDPEVDTNLVYGRNPNTRQVSFGLNLSF